VGTIIIGIGNPVLTDDSVGLKIADRLRDRLRGWPGVDVTQLCCGGINLMEAMTGYDRAIIIDAMTGGGGKAGTVYEFGPAGLSQSRNTWSGHDASLQVAMALGSTVGLRLPAHVHIWAVEAYDVCTYSEQLTPDVERAVPLVVDNVVRDLESGQPYFSGRTTT
jgi:hydrogenase maturation protease